MAQPTDRLILDSGALSALTHRSSRAASHLMVWSTSSAWPPVVPTVVLVESLRGHAGLDANTNRFLKACLINPTVSPGLARRAAELRRQAQKGSAVDAIVVAIAEPGGTVLTGDGDDLRALAAYASGVRVVEL